MTDYPLTLTGPYYNAGAATDYPATWFGDGNPATVVTFLYDSGEFGYNLSGDYTTVPNIIGWRVEVDVISGTGQLLWDIAADASTGSGYVAFHGYLTVDGPGTYAGIAGSPYFVSSTGGHTYGGIYDLLARIANEAVYPHGYGTIERVSGSTNIVASEMRVIFFTAATPVLRQLHRRDGLGQASVGRLGAATNSVRRVIGGQP